MKATNKALECHRESSYDVFTLKAQRIPLFTSYFDISIMAPTHLFMYQEFVIILVTFNESISSYSWF